MKSFTILSAAMGVTLANAQLFECDGYRRPNWDDCSNIVGDWGGNMDFAHEGTSPGQCMLWHGGNCRIAHCWKEQAEEGENFDITFDYARNVVEDLRYRCDLFRAGGQWNSGADYIEVHNNEDAIGAEKRETKRDFEVTTEKMSLDEYLELKNDTINHPDPALRKRIMSQRQVDDDDVVSIDFQALGVRHGSEFERGPRLSSGIGYTYETTDSRTFGVTTSITVGGGWNIFTAEVNTQISQEDTFTIREGLEFNVDCRNQGQVTFYPYYDYYQVTFWPSATSADIWVPADVGDYQVTGEISVACLG